MKLCYIISDIDKAVYFEETALSLRQQGIEPDFVLINCKNGSLASFLHESKFNVFALEAPGLLRSWPQIQKVKRFLKEQKTTIVHCHLADANWIGLWAAKLAGVQKRIYTRHSGEPLQITWKEKLIDKIQNRLATKIIAITQMIDNLLTRQGVPSSKRQIIHHGFHLELFQNPNHVVVDTLKKKYNLRNHFPIVGVNARWLELKGIQYIFPAFKQLLITHPKSKILLFGGNRSGDYFEELNKLTQEIPKENLLTVSFENDVYSLYHLFDVYIHVPINPTCEAFGQTYVEALAAGIPSIFTLSGVACEFIEHEKNALVVPFKNSSAIYESMIQLLENSELRNHIIQQGKQDVQELFSFNQYISNLVELYNE